MTRPIATKYGYAATPEQARALRELDPRVAVWLRANEYTFADIYTPPDAPPATVTRWHGSVEERVPWQTEFETWLEAQRNTWALERACILAFTPKEQAGDLSFITWLEKTYPFVKACKCGRTFSPGTWRTLAYVGLQPGLVTLELRNCSCGTTLSVDAEAVALRSVFDHGHQQPDADSE